MIDQEWPLIEPELTMADMTMRDYFAGQVLSGSAAVMFTTGSGPEEIAKFAYRQADVMLEVRKKQEQGDK